MELGYPLKKSLGQHLLKDKNLLLKMVRQAAVGSEDTVAEIGPGHGDLTRIIAPRVHKMFAIELDERWKGILEALKAEHTNLELIFGDVLHVRFSDFCSGQKIVVMGNIPYNITGEILFKLLSEKAAIRAAYLTMQKEVAERLVSRSHSKTYGALSVIFQLHAAMKVLSLIKPALFVPPPKVDNAYISIVFKENRHLDDRLTGFVKTCFRHKRKFLRHSLEGTYGLEEIKLLYKAMGFLPSVRAEEIEPEEFVTMYEHLERRAAHG
jgi:16S rRNA (adenine1518-N6/adenine1519-N6)-dimethyltransferase